MLNRFDRSRLAVAGLLVAGAATALAGVSASADAAHPARPVHPVGSTGSAAHHAPTVTIRLTDTSLRLSSSHLTPGNDVFKVRRAGGGGSVDIVRLRQGYTLADFGADAGKAFSGKVHAVRRLDRHVVFFGGVGVPSSKQDPGVFAIHLGAGSYYVVNVDQGSAVPLEVSGHAHGGSLPGTHGSLGMVGSMRFTDTAAIHEGWVSISNHATQPHFVVLNQVKRSTTERQLHRYFMSNAQNPPSFALPVSLDTNPISPGHTMLWKVGVPTGRYAELCFWPSDETGAPHAYMGMNRLLSVRR